MVDKKRRTPLEFAKVRVQSEKIKSDIIKIFESSDEANRTMIRKIKEALMLSTPMQKQKRSFNVVIVFSGLMLFSYFTLHFIGFPFFIFESAQFLKTLCMACFIGCLVFGTISAALDPGYLETPKNNDLMQIFKETDPSYLCFECSLITTLRSRHCNVCHRCVDVFDHHCPWINNCIGKRNIIPFYLFIFLQAVYLFGVLSLVLKFFIGLIKDSEDMFDD